MASEEKCFTALAQRADHSGKRVVMPLSLSQIWLHLVFSTKNRQVLLQNPGFRDEMFLMLNQPLREIGCLPKCTGGWIDHVHIVCELVAV